MAGVRLISLKDELEQRDNYVTEADLEFKDFDKNNKVLFNKLFIDDSKYKLISSSPKIFSAIHKDDFGKNFYISEAEMDYYISGFLQSVKDNVDEILKKSVADGAEDDLNKAALDDSDVKLNLYRSFKSLYDKWINSSEDGDTSGYFFNNYGKDKDERMLFDHFKFVNRANQDVGSKAAIDFTYLSNLANTQNGQGPTQSLYQSLTELLGKNNFDFWPLPANIDFTTQNMSNDDVKDMFKALDYVGDIKAFPLFLCVYVGGSSRTLADLSGKGNNCYQRKDDFNYVDDSFDLTDSNDWPEEYNNSDDNGLIIFKVRYGQEAQNHFYGLQLDQTEFKETQESLEIIDAMTNPKTGSQPSQAGKGNNMYDAYLTRSYNCTVSALGNMSIQPLMYFKLENVPMFRGTYLITGVKHTVTPHNIKTEFTGMRQPRVTVPVVTDAISLLDLSLIDVNETAGTSGSGLISTQTSGTIEQVQVGPGLEPAFNLIASKESDGGDYEIYNFGTSGSGGIRSSTVGSKFYKSDAIKLTDKTTAQIIDLQAQGKMFAVGKFQTIPITLNSVATKLGIGEQLFNKETQDKIGTYLITGSSRKSLANYLKGTNEGTQENLEKAVQDLGQEFASLPIITKGGITWGDVVKGTGNKAFYGGSGPNPDTVTTTVGTVVNVLIKSRIQYSGKNPSFIPTYYVS
jgi:hypothetical protein